MTYDCTATTHRWPPVFTDGDSCNCGAFYLSQTADGFRLVEAPDLGEDEEDDLVDDDPLAAGTDDEDDEDREQPTEEDA